MTPQINYHRHTDTLTVRLSRTPGVLAATSTDGVLSLEMTPEQWLGVIGEVQREIDLLQSCQAKWEQCREEFEAGRLAALAAELAKGQAADADLAAKIAEHGGAT